MRARRAMPDRPLHPWTDYLRPWKLFTLAGVIALLRAHNFPASLALYGACGVPWLYRGSLGRLLAGLAEEVGGVRR
jgi:hypothetical protein